MDCEESIFLFEDQWRREGRRWIAGVDEAGRGPLAGPVTAAAVMLPGDLDPHALAGVRDSKQLNESERERLYELIVNTAASYAVAHATPREIDALDIRKASLLAMKRAVEKLSPAPDYVLVDGRDYPDLDIPGEAVIKGDQKSLAVGAASILAKVTRDRMMDSLHARHPQYGLDRHKGYPTQYHRDALMLFGASAIHRKTFAHVPAADYLPPVSPEFREMVQRLEAAKSGEEFSELRGKLESLNLAERERSHLQRRIDYAMEAMKKAMRLYRPASVDVGADKETFALKYMQRKGYRLWDRNFHCREGEIDLVFNRDSLIVFVEVKSRSSKKFGMPYEAVTAAKRRKIIRAAERYLYERGLLDGWDIRYDIISILAPKNQTPQIEHFEDAFRVEGELEGF
ncbi:MAG: ribonuclease HII [Candidatus Omnitrophica bacterium]|nr:ribonuclease HII [Candidatus Omnitrophota bacterium]